MKADINQEAHTSTSAEILGPNNPPRVRRQWAQNYKHLLELRARLLRERNDLQQQATTELPVEQLHQAESASDEFDHNLAWTLLSSEQDALSEIEEALRRIQQGTYGICQVTGKRIPRDRLNSIPWTRFTIEAQRELEKQRGLPTPHFQRVRSITRKTGISPPEGDSLGELEVTGSHGVRTNSEITLRLERLAREEEEDAEKERQLRNTV